MKVALVNNRFSSSHGGLERFACNLARTLLSNGHEVHLFAQSIENVPTGAWQHQIRVARKPAFLRIWSFANKVRSALKNEDFDIVYGLTRTVPLDIYRMGDGVQRHWLALRYPQPLQRWLYCFVNLTHGINLYLEKKVFNPRNCRMWVSNSKLCQDHAVRYLNVERERVRVIYNGVDHAQFNTQAARTSRESVRQNYGIDKEDIAIVYVAHNWRRKGLAVLLRAMARLGQSGCHLHLLVVGRGKPAQFETLISDLALSQRVHFVGATHDVVDYYGAGDLFVLPTQYDPFSNVCLEAMACGLPVITTKENGAAEVVEHGTSGFLQENPDSEEELAQWLEQCLDREKLIEMGQRAEETSKTFTLERNLEETLALFRQIAAEKGADKDARL